MRLFQTRRRTAATKRYRRDFFSFFFQCRPHVQRRARLLLDARLRRRRNERPLPGAVHQAALPANPRRPGRSRDEEVPTQPRRRSRRK